MPVPSWRELWTDVRLRFAGQKRTAPYGTRGRTHAPTRPTAPPPAPGVTKSEPKGYVSARIRRADGTIEDLGVIAEADVKGLMAELHTPREG